MAEQWPGCWLMSPASCVRMFWLDRVLPALALSPSHICHLVTVFTPRVSRLILEQGQNKGSQKTLISASDLTRTLSAPVSAGAGHISLDSVWLWAPRELGTEHWQQDTHTPVSRITWANSDEEECYQQGWEHFSPWPGHNKIWTLLYLLCGATTWGWPVVHQPGPITLHCTVYHMQYRLYRLTDDWQPPPVAASWPPPPGHRAPHAGSSHRPGLKHSDTK